VALLLLLPVALFVLESKRTMMGVPSVVKEAETIRGGEGEDEGGRVGAREGREEKDVRVGRDEPRRQCVVRRESSEAEGPEIAMSTA
jgi:hypothetical protein